MQLRKAEPLIDDERVLWAARAMGRAMGALSKSPGDAGALRLMAGACYVFGLRTGLLHLHKHALSAYEEMLQNDPKDLQSLSHMGRVQACLGRHDDALDWREKVIGNDQLS